MSTPPPAFGPTEPIPCDDDHEPFATVRVALILSRQQLRAALAIGHAEQAGQPSLDELDILDVRREVEGYLAAGATFELERQAITSRLPAELVAELDAAIDRAYAPVTAGEKKSPDLESFSHRVQSPRYGDGTVTLQTLDSGEITIAEPAWCVGHDSEEVRLRVDVSHVGATVAAEYAGLQFLPACISWGPFAERRPEPYPLADVDEFPSMEPDELRELAAEVGLHAGRLYSKANELDRIRRGQS